MDKLTERKKMLVAMEFVARQINDEDYMISDKGFAEIMSCFLRRMVRAYNSGALYCGGVVCKEKSDYGKEGI